jgi:choice-of-anchor A domain-containing protein
VSFQDFTSLAADVEGRLAVARDATLTGYNIGYQLQTETYENSLPFALVVGRDLSFSDGSVYPDGSNTPYPGQKENIFVGSTFTGPQYLADRVTSCNGQAGCLDSAFTAAKRCYAGFQSELAEARDNVQVAVQFGGLLLTCDSSEDNRHVASVTPQQLADITYYVIQNCNFQAQWVLNIRGFGDVTVQGDNFPGNPGAVIYNFLGTGRTLNIANSFWGSILAPFNNVYQLNGVVIGKVVAGNIPRIHQVNIVHCPTPGNITLQLPTGVASPAGNIIYLYSIGNARVGDTVVNAPGAPNSLITEVDEEANTITLEDSHGPINDDFLLNVKVADPTASRKMVKAPVFSTEDNVSSASIFGPAFALLAVLLLFM